MGECYFPGEIVKKSAIIKSLSLRLEASAILNGFIGLLYKSTASKRNRVKIKQKMESEKKTGKFRIEAKSDM